MADNSFEDFVKVVVGKNRLSTRERAIVGCVQHFCDIASGYTCDPVEQGECVHSILKEASRLTIANKRFMEANKQDRLLQAAICAYAAGIFPDGCRNKKNENVEKIGIKMFLETVPTTLTAKENHRLFAAITAHTHPQSKINSYACKQLEIIHDKERSVVKNIVSPTPLAALMK